MNVEDAEDHGDASEQKMVGRHRRSFVRHRLRPIQNVLMSCPLLYRSDTALAMLAQQAIVDYHHERNERELAYVWNVIVFLLFRFYEEHPKRCYPYFAIRYCAI
jgi:hypothetical protein